MKYSIEMKGDLCAAESSKINSQYSFCRSLHELSSKMYQNDSTWPSSQEQDPILFRTSIHFQHLDLPRQKSILKIKIREQVDRIQNYKHDIVSDS
jgi:hypothetical protein